MSKKYNLCDIDDSIIDLMDMYIKAVIGNSKIDELRKIECRKKAGFIVYRIEGFEEELIYNEPSFENILMHRFQVNGTEFFVRNENLAKALLNLTDIQREIVFQTEIAERTQRDIAKELGISFQMISKYRKAALKKLREELENEKKH